MNWKFLNRGKQEEPAPTTDVMDVAHVLEHRLDMSANREVDVAEILADIKKRLDALEPVARLAFTYVTRADHEASVSRIMQAIGRVGDIVDKPAPVRVIGTVPQPAKPGPKSDLAPVKVSPNLKAARNAEICRRRSEGGPALAKEFGLTTSRIYQIFGAEGEFPRPTGKHVNLDMDRVIADYRSIKSLAKVAKIHGTTSPTIRDRLMKAGEPILSSGRRKKGRTLKVVRKAIARDLKAGFSKTVIAKNYGVSLSTVKRAAKRFGDEVQANPWVDEDKVQTLKDIWPDKGWTVPDMAALLGVTEGAVRMKARRLQLPARS